MWTVTLLVTTVIADAIAAILKAIVGAVAEHYNIPEDDAIVVVANQIIDLAALLGVGTGTLYSKIGIKAADYLGIKAAGTVRRAVSANAAVKIAVVNANTAKSASAGALVWGAISKLPATQVLMFLMLGQNIGDWYFFKTALFTETINGIFGKDTVKAPNTGSGATGFSNADFAGYAASVESAGVTAISSPRAGVLAPYSRDDLAKLLTWLYGQQLITGGGTGVKAIEAAAQPYLIYAPKSGQYAASLYNQNTTQAAASGGNTTQVASRAAATVAASSTVTTPKIFTGVVSQGVLSSASDFTPRPDDLIQSIGELETAAANNLTPYIASLPGRIVYEVKVQTSIRTASGFTQRGTTQRIVVGSYKNGTPKYKTVTNKFAVMNLYILSDTGSRHKLTQIVLGPTDAVAFQPSDADLNTVQSFLQAGVHTTNVAQIASVSSTPQGVLTAAASASVSSQQTATPAQVLAPLIHPVGVFTAIGDYGTTLYRELADGTILTFSLISDGSPLFTNSTERGSFGNAGAQATEAKIRLRAQYGIDWDSLPQRNLADINAQQRDRGLGYNDSDGAFHPQARAASSIAELIGTTNTASGTQTTTAAAPSSSACVATSLSQFYTAQSLALPSIADRAILYQSFGLGQSNYYAGTAEQNTKLLAALKVQLGCSI